MLWGIKSLLLVPTSSKKASSPAPKLDMIIYLSYKLQYRSEIVKLPLKKISQKLHRHGNKEPTMILGTKYQFHRNYGQKGLFFAVVLQSNYN